MAIANPAASVRARRGSTDVRIDTPTAAPIPRDAEQAAVQAQHIRRCAYRLVSALPARRTELPMYDVSCLHPTYDAAVALGGLDAARAACAACELPGVFRPDED